MTSNVDDENGVCIVCSRTSVVERRFCQRVIIFCRRLSSFFFCFFFVGVGAKSWQLGAASLKLVASRVSRIANLVGARGNL